MRRFHGSITVFMSLWLSAAILFTGTLLESVRYSLLRNQAVLAAEASMDSLMAGFSTDLFDEFGLLLLDAEDLSNFQTIEDLLEKYLASEFPDPEDGGEDYGNLFRMEITDVKVKAATNALSKGGDYLLRSILDFMKYKELTILLSEVSSQLDQLAQGDTARETKITEESEEIRNADNPESESAFTEADYEELAKRSIIGEFRRIQKNGFLELILPVSSVVSQKTTTKSGFPSISGLGQLDGEQAFLSYMNERFLLSEYCLRYLNSFTDQKGNGTLSYELEYVLYGNASDEKNLRACIRDLLLVREGMNIITILSDSGLSQQAFTLADTLAGWTMLPPVVAAVKAALVSAWAYAESILDVRTLAGGGKVPLVKKKEDWNTKLNQVSDIFSGLLKAGGKTENGLNYEGYLRLLFLRMAKKEQKYYLLDMIQCRIADYKSGFMLNNCLYGIEAEVTFRAKSVFPGFHNKKEWYFTISASGHY